MEQLQVTTENRLRSYYPGSFLPCQKILKTKALDHKKPLYRCLLSPWKKWNDNYGIYRKVREDTRRGRPTAVV